jgi:hypothetical protein
VITSTTSSAVLLSLKGGFFGDQSAHALKAGPVEFAVSDCR